ncbi:MAG: helix-turn-helix transcriptional regulator [Chloroflexi bacterium]|nr:helix-turn-helix transcriptional regulator [Chloroflexota bacterium]
MPSITKAPDKPTLLGERVRIARHALGLSQSQLAGAELTKGFISQIESGLVRPSVRSLQIIANRLGKPFDYFIGDDPAVSRKRLAFHRLAAEAAMTRQDWPALRSEIEAALRESPDKRERCRLVGMLSAADLGEGDREMTFTRIAEALSGLDLDADAADIAQLLYRKGRAYAQLEQLVAATDAYEASRAMVEKYEINDTRLRSRLLVALGTMYRRLNRTAKAMATYEAALAQASRASEQEMAARSYMGVAATLYDAGEYDSAISNYRRALALWQHLADSDFELNAMQSLAGVHFEQGDLVAAREMATRCLSRAESLGDRRWAAVARVELARGELAAGHIQEALSLADPAERVLAELDDPQQQASALRILGAAHEAAGDHGAADRAYLASIELLTGIDHFASRSVTSAEYAQHLRARGEIDKAFSMLELARGAAARH